MNKECDTEENFSDQPNHFFLGTKTKALKEGKRFVPNHIQLTAVLNSVINTFSQPAT